MHRTNSSNKHSCGHGSVKQCSSKSARARRRVLDKQAWKVLKKLYPESVQLEAHGLNGGGCLLCAAEAETVKKAESDKKEVAKSNRKKPLANDLVRGVYTRGSKGYPLNCVVPPSSASGSLTTRCPLKPGVYCGLPRSWCHRWRKYLKTGEGGFPPAPDVSEVLCDAHNLPLIPSHLEAFLRGETSALLGGSTQAAAPAEESEVASMPVAVVGASSVARSGSVSRSTNDAETLQALRAAGMSESELHSQKLAMEGLEYSMRNANIHDIHEFNRVESESTSAVGGLQLDRTVTNEQLDRENRVVVEILTDDEVTALEKSMWPVGCHGGAYALRFAVVEGSSGSDTEVVWSTMPCRVCDPSSRSSDAYVVRNRLQKRGYR